MKYGSEGFAGISVVFDASSLTVGFEGTEEVNEGR